MAGSAGAPAPHAQFVFKVLVVALAVALLAALWQAAQVVLVVFAGTLFAIFLRRCARPLHDKLHVPVRLAVALVLLALFGVLVAGILAIGPAIAEQLDQLLRRMPESIEQLQSTLGDYAWGRFLLDLVPDGAPETGGAGGVMRQITGVFSFTVAVAVYAVTMVMLGIFLAMSPDMYRKPAIRLLPPRLRGRGEEVLARLGHALWYWLLGVFIAMIGVGVLTTLGLSLIGVPLALVLGTIAGLLNIIPFFGPMLSAIPALLMAATVGFNTVIYVVLLFVVVQQIEGNILTPLAQEHTVHIPPAVTITAVVLFAVLFGPLGAILGTPLAVALMVLVRMVYIEEVLEGRSRAAGAASAPR